MENLKKWLKKHSFLYESKTMQGNYEGVFVELEIVENSVVLGRVNDNALLRYLTKRKLKWEYRGHYTSLLIWE